MRWLPILILLTQCGCAGTIGLFYSGKPGPVYRLTKPLGIFFSDDQRLTYLPPSGPCTFGTGWTSSTPLTQLEPGTCVEVETDAVAWHREHVVHQRPMEVDLISPLPEIEYLVTVYLARIVTGPYAGRMFKLDVDRWRQVFSPVRT